MKDSRIPLFLVLTAVAASFLAGDLWAGRKGFTEIPDEDFTLEGLPSTLNTYGYTANLSPLNDVLDEQIGKELTLHRVAIRELQHAVRDLQRLQSASTSVQKVDWSPATK